WIGGSLYGIICKSNSVSPAILGCPIDQIIAKLCDDKTVKITDTRTTENTLSILQTQTTIVKVDTQPSKDFCLRFWLFWYRI
ncbi:MAG: hypothetical protein ACSW8H_08065, partial [bacterium]